MGRQPRSTNEVLALRALGTSVDQRFVAWAVAQLESGLDTPHLRILAGESSPFNQLEMLPLLDRVLGELELEYPRDTESAIKIFTRERVRAAIDGSTPSSVVLDTLSRLCIEFDYPESLYDFYLLQQARSALEASHDQYYWPGANRENIDSIINSHFATCMTNNASPTVFKVMVRGEGLVAEVDDASLEGLGFYIAHWVTAETPEEASRVAIERVRRSPQVEGQETLRVEVEELEEVGPEEEGRSPTGFVFYPMQEEGGGRMDPGLGATLCDRVFGLLRRVLPWRQGTGERGGA